MRAGIAVVCRMARLEIFGSVSGGADFDPGIGDADFQVEFGHQARVGDMDLAGDLHVLLDREGIGQFDQEHVPAGSGQQVTRSVPVVPLEDERRDRNGER